MVFSSGNIVTLAKVGLRLHDRDLVDTKRDSGRDFLVSNIYDMATSRHIKYLDNISMMGISAMVILRSPADRIDWYKRLTVRQSPPMLTNQPISLLLANRDGAESHTAETKAPFPLLKTHRLALSLVASLIGLLWNSLHGIKYRRHSPEKLSRITMIPFVALTCKQDRQVSMFVPIGDCKWSKTLVT